jgi:signal peptide peptidase SppA
MRVIDVLNSPWAIIPDKLQEIQAIYATHLRGDKIDIKALEIKLGQPLQKKEQGYETIDGVAVIVVDGVISKRMNLFSQISGGASTELIGRDIRQALADPEAHSLLLQVDSPGGTVDGTQELAQMIHGARGAKPIVTYVDGMMASAAYWIGSAADAAYIGADTAQVGSIGVVASHTDYSRREEMLGMKTTEIYAGKFKRIASSYKPLSEDGKQYIQDMVDYLYSVFVADVAKQRGTDTETVLTNMADGRVFTGRQAVEAGLVDGVATMDRLIAQLNQGKNQRDSRKASLAAIAAALAR